jgi:hypothetical protein
MKTFKITKILVSIWVGLALLLDAVMIYGHFFNPEVTTIILSCIDKVIR